jgi:hypothetical protein
MYPPADERTVIVDVERTLRDAFLVLDCIDHCENQRLAVAQAIRLYGLGSYEAAAALALAMIKGRSLNVSSYQAASESPSIAHLKAQFEATRLAQRQRQTHPQETHPSHAHKSPARSGPG